MILQTIARFWKEQSGVIGVESAIIVLSLVVVSSVFATSALSAGAFFTNSAQETIGTSLNNLSVVELRGSIVLTASATGSAGVVSDITFQVANVTGGHSIDLSPGKIIIRYTDGSQSKNFDSSSGFVVSRVGNADSDTLLEPDELFEITLSDLDSAGSGKNQLTNTLGADTTFTLEVVPPQGSVLTITRTTATYLDSTMWLN